MFDPKADLADIKRFQSEIRSVIRRSALTANERDVCVAIVNLWWGKNKNSQNARGLGMALVPIHPGTKKIAFHAKVKIRSAYRAMNVLKSLSIIRVVEHQKGGRHAARLTVCFHHILAIENQTKTELHLAFLADLKGCHLADLTSDILADGKVPSTVDYNQENIIRFSDYRKPSTERSL